MTAGVIFSVKEFTLHDGPGIRSTVFFKGCPLRCAWCHNPEGLAPIPQLMVKQSQCTHCGKCRRGCSHETCRPFDRCAKICPQDLIEIVGETMGAPSLAQRLKRNMDFYEADGGVTLSGGEPLMQPAFLMELLKELLPLHRAIETSGYAAETVFEAAAREADLIIMDLKLMDAQRHKQATGVDNAPILQNLRILKSLQKDFLIRIPLIPGVNTDEENLGATAKALADCVEHVRVELLPYNTLAGAKYQSIGMDFGMPEDLKPVTNDACAPFARHGVFATML